MSVEIKDPNDSFTLAEIADAVANYREYRCSMSMDRVERLQHDAYRRGFEAAKAEAVNLVFEALHTKITEDRSPLCVLKEVARKIEALKPEDV